MIELLNTSMNLSMKSMKRFNLQHNSIQYGVGSLLHLSRLSQLRGPWPETLKCPALITHMLSLIRVHARMLMHAVTLLQNTNSSFVTRYIIMAEKCFLPLLS